MGFVDQHVTDGHYPSRSAAVTEAIADGLSGQSAL